MKWNILLLLLSEISIASFAQNLQLHYDLRHTLDPGNNAKNYPTLYFDYFKAEDSSSFLLKMQADLKDGKNNMGQFYMQIAKTLRFWKPKIFLHVSYSGGLGLTEPRQYSYVINNTLQLGAAYPFHLGNAWLSAVLDFKYVPFDKPSYDAIYTLYWWKGLWNYKFEVSGDFSIWSENKNHGDSLTMTRNGKKIAFFGEPQIWFNLNKKFSLGSKINLYFHLLSDNDRVQVYPTIALKYKI